MANAYRDENNVPTLIAASNADGKTPVRLYADPVTHRLLVDVPAGGVTIYNDTVSGTIDGVNRSFTVPNSISANGAIALFLAGAPYQQGVDYTYSGTTITMTIAPDASLSGQPFWMAHI